MTGFATMTSKNQLTLPADMVQLLTWPAGTNLWVTTQEEKVVLEKVLSLAEIRSQYIDDPRIQKINAKYSSAEIVRMARRKKPPKHLYDY